MFSCMGGGSVDNVVSSNMPPNDGGQGSSGVAMGSAKNALAESGSQKNLKVGKTVECFKARFIFPEIANVLKIVGKRCSKVFDWTSMVKPRDSEILADLKFVEETFSGTGASSDRATLDELNDAKEFLRKLEAQVAKLETALKGKATEKTFDLTSVKTESNHDVDDVFNNFTQLASGEGRVCGRSISGPGDRQYIWDTGGTFIKSKKPKVFKGAGGESSNTFSIIGDTVLYEYKREGTSAYTWCTFTDFKKKLETDPY